MIFMTQKQFERKMDRMKYEMEERERTFRRFEELDKQICDLQLQLHDLKTKIDRSIGSKRWSAEPRCSADHELREPAEE